MHQKGGEPTLTPFNRVMELCVLIDIENVFLGIIFKIQNSNFKLGHLRCVLQ
jgi:hypothetical protein